MIAAPQVEAESEGNTEQSFQANTLWWDQLIHGAAMENA